MLSFRWQFEMLSFCATAAAAAVTVCRAGGGEGEEVQPRSNINYVATGLGGHLKQFARCSLSLSDTTRRLSLSLSVSRPTSVLSHFLRTRSSERAAPAAATTTMTTASS